MLIRRTLAAVVFVMAIVVSLSEVLAVPSGPGPIGAVKEGQAEDGLVQKLHGCHRSCERSAVLGWHRHVGLACVPVACAPRAPYPNRCWVDWRGVRYCRW
jgi:hypothetical protein